MPNIREIPPEPAATQSETPPWLQNVRTTAEQSGDWETVPPPPMAAPRRIQPRLIGPRQQPPTTALVPEKRMWANPDRPLGFNCPACSVVLVIREPDKYDGRPAPCPHCKVTISPPQIVQEDAIDLHPLPGLSSKPGAAARLPRLLRSGRHHGAVNS